MVVALAAAVIIGRSVVEARLRGYSNTYGATIVHYPLTSTLLGRSVDELAVVPPGSTRRPLLILLHGRHDPKRFGWLIHERSGPESMLNDALLHALSRLGARAPVVVMLNGGAHSYFHNRRDGKWGSMILHEAIPNAVRRFHTQPGRIAIGGISMGGYGALLAASREPKRFCAVGGHSAALWLAPGDSAPGAFDDREDFLRYDVFAAAKRGRLDKLPIWLDVGSSDGFRPADAALATLLQKRGARVSFHTSPGGHDRTYWHSHMTDHFHFYASALAHCR